ncbi:hypothetical protein GEMRC1_013275 [Eukaryota sp. GEM-RC1]
MPQIRDKIQITLAYGTSSGSTKKLVNMLKKELDVFGFLTLIKEANTIIPADLEQEEYFIFISSTVGRGKPPKNAQVFVESVLSDKSPLPNLKFSVIGVGDSSYSQFNVVAKTVHAALLEKQATPLLDPLLIDVKSDDISNIALSWFNQFLPKFNMDPATKSTIDLEDLSEALPNYERSVYSCEPAELSLETQGYVHSIESFSAVDGAGIRYIVFLQGCRLRCVFCCNPDSWAYGSGKFQSVGEIMKGFRRCLPFIRSSERGGITIGGGDPLTQPNFTAALCRFARAEGVTAAIETAGDVADTKAWEIVLPEADYIILCAKAFTADVFKRLTRGGQISTMFRFVDKCIEMGVTIWLTYVVLPGYTDSDEEIEGLCGFLKNPRVAEIIERVEILPYHRLGKFKYDEMGLEYPLEGVGTPQRELLTSIVDRVKKVFENVYL